MAAAAELGRLREVDRTITHLRRAINAQERRLAILIEEARRGGTAGPPAAEALAHAGHPALAALYVSLQDDFRGTREEIKDRLQTYLPLLAEAGAGKAARILDLGCGRGEWLELLGEQSLNASGVDSNQEMVRLCRELNLDVAEGDAIAYLRALPPASAGMVTGFHVLEHLGLTEVLNLLDEVLRVLIPGGLAIFETPNPESVSVSTHTFYLDPTHHHPLPALLSRFLLEARGYSGVEIRYLHPCSPEQFFEDSGSEVVRRFNQQFYGPRDYAVIGRKSGPVDTAPCES
jgi:SAM-dependent methyltransferase